MAPSRSPGSGGWPGGLQETCTTVDADREDALGFGAVTQCAKTGPRTRRRARGLSTLLATRERVLNQLSGQLARGSGEWSPGLACTPARGLAVICSCHSRQGTCVMRKVNQSALRGHELFKEAPSDFSHFMVPNQHLCPGRSWTKGRLPAFRTPQVLLAGPATGLAGSGMAGLHLRPQSGFIYSTALSLVVVIPPSLYSFSATWYWQIWALTFV